MERQTCNVKETSEILGVCKSTVMRLVTEGKLRALRPSPRRILIPVSAIKEYLNDRA